MATPLVQKPSLQKLRFCRQVGFQNTISIHINMIAIARKKISCLCSNPNLFLCNSNVHSIHLIPTSQIRCHEIYDVLVHKHQFSPELASLISSRLPQFRSPKRADSILSYLKESSFTTSQLERIVIYNPRILGLTVEGMKFKFKVFQDLGLSPEEIAKIISMNRSILHSNTESKIIPRISQLKALLGSNHDVAKLLKRSAWFVVSDLEKTLMPNVEILKSRSIPMERILYLLHLRPRCLLVKSDIMRKSVDRAIEFGFCETSVAFIHAVGLFTHMSEGMWEVKLETLRDLGFSDSDIFSIFRKQPYVFSASGKKMKNVIELLLATGKYSISNIVSCPVAFGCSIEKRLRPRLQVLRLLESRDLIEKWPTLSVVVLYSDDKFFDSFIKPYYDEIGKEYITKIYIEGRKK